MSEWTLEETLTVVGIPLVYDVGMNHGEDSQYYLAKGCRVVGIDANKAACKYCSRLFEREISTGQMTVLNIGVSDTEDELDFYINLRKDKISTFSPENFAPFAWAPKLWNVEKVKTTKLSRIIEKYGEAHYIKIDVEYFDFRILYDLNLNNIRPKYISTECHDIRCFQTLKAMGYTKFKIVNGATVHEEYGKMKISCLNGSSIEHDFRLQSSGPYGEDLPGNWLTGAEAAAALQASGLGWIDVHACA